jgi:hypothetical protein
MDTSRRRTLVEDVDVLRELVAKSVPIERRARHRPWDLDEMSANGTDVENIRLAHDFRTEEGAAWSRTRTPTKLNLPLFGVIVIACLLSY